MLFMILNVSGLGDVHCVNRRFWSSEADKSIDSWPMKRIEWLGSESGSEESRVSGLVDPEMKAFAFFPCGSPSERRTCAPPGSMCRRSIGKRRTSDESNCKVAGH